MQAKLIDVFYVLAVCVAGALLVGCTSQQTPPDISQIAGSYMLTIGDADMDATTFSTAALPPIADSTDELTVLTLPLREPQTPWAQINVSSSALGPPTALALSRVGDLAIVVETKGPATSDTAFLSDLPPGDTIAAVDLSTPLSPFVRDTLTVADNAMAAAIDPSSRYVAVVCKDPGRQINIAKITSDGFAGPPDTWPLIGLPDDAEPSSVAWHDNGKILAVTVPSLDLVAFYQFKRTPDGELALRPHGNPVTVGKYPYSGAFTKDSKYFITTNLQWGADVDGFFISAPKGSLSVIRVDPSTAEPQHAVTDTAPTGISPEGLAISPAGNAVVTANLNRSFLPQSDPRFLPGTLTLLGFDDTVGTLRPIAEYPLNALPEGVTFDPSGRFVAATLFRSFDAGAAPGEVTFFSLTDAPKLQLHPTGVYVAVGTGPHSIIIAP